MHMYVTSALQNNDMKAVMLKLAMDLYYKKVFVAILIIIIIITAPVAPPPPWRAISDGAGPFRNYMYMYYLYQFNLSHFILSLSLCPSLLFLFHSNLSNLSKGRPCKLPLLACRCAFFTCVIYV